MAQQQDIILNENNDENVNVTITTNNPVAGTALNLAGMSLEAYLKPSKTTSDTDASVWKGTSVGGQITVTDTANGKVTISIPASAVTLTHQWWRLDVLSSGGLRKTAVYGVVTVNDL